MTTQAGSSEELTSVFYPEPVVPTGEEVETEEVEAETVEEVVETESEPVEAEAEAEDDSESDDAGESEEIDPEEKESGYLRDKDYRQKTMKLADERREFDTSREEFEAEMAEKRQNAADYLNKLAKMVNEPDDAEEMAELKEIDPAQYLIRKQEKEEQAQVLKDAQEAHAKKQKADFKAYKDDQLSKLAEVMKWTDEDTAKSDFKKAADYALDRGATAEQFEMVVNHIELQAFIDAAKYHELKADIDSKKSAVEKQVKKAPKSVKTSQKASKTESVEDLFYG